MTAICPAGGASQPKPGQAGTVQLLTTALAALAVNWPVRYTLPYVVGLTGVNLNLSTFCAIDPPADPGLTAADGLALLNLPTGGTATVAASAKLVQLLLRYAWYQVCECVTAPTPAPPTPPLAPTGWPDGNPPLANNAPGSCQSVIGTPYTTGVNPRIIRPAVTNYAANGTTVTGGLPSSSIYRDLTTPYVVDVDVQPTTKYIYASACLSNVGPAFCTGNEPNITVLTLVPTNATSVRVTFVGGGVVGTDGWVRADMAVFCGGVVPQPISTPCPPDPVTLALLDQILSMVTLIQRQEVPFAYVSSTVHAGLTNYGTLAIQGLIGVRVDITAGAAGLRSVGNLPPYLFNGGFITFGTSDGFPSSYRIKHNPQLCMPARASAYTSLTYDLPPGVTISITELVREP